MRRGGVRKIAQLRSPHRTILQVTATLTIHPDGASAAHHLSLDSVGRAGEEGEGLPGRQQQLRQVERRWRGHGEHVGASSDDVNRQRVAGELAPASVEARL
jgi:hypothetical protein